MAAGTAQQLLLCQASQPSLPAMAATTRAATGSAQDQSRVALRTQARQEDGRRVGAQQRLLDVGDCAVRAEFARLALRWAADRDGITARGEAATTMPGIDRSDSPVPASARMASTVTIVASTKKETAMIRRVVFSRTSRTACSRAENCQATATAEETSMIES